ncbi:MAG TPA: ATP-binding cassette domain-containing protein [Methanomassiliicoccales archaeon]|jgi:cobalt/nickel transport system ATP-binding protein
MTDEMIIETRGLTYAYANKVVALDDINMTIPKGKKTALLGPNGAGKSTLFLHFNGIFKPKAGTVSFEGKEISYRRNELDALRSSIAVVLQNPDDQIFSATVEEDVAFGPMNMGLPRDEVERRVAESLSFVGMDRHRERPTQQLSFGQRKRVSLAGALAMRPKVLVMDEPTAGLDAQMVHELLELADELNYKGLTVIMSTHDVETAYAWADEIRVLDRGKLIYSGDPNGFFVDAGRVRRLGLSVPMMFEMNRELSDRSVRPLGPYPRTTLELAQKFAPFGALRGVLSLFPTEDLPDRQEGIRSDILCRTSSTGTYGAVARRLMKERSISVDYSFDALENCIHDVITGKDATIFAEKPLFPLIESRLARFNREYGIDIRPVNKPT